MVSIRTNDGRPAPRPGVLARGALLAVPLLFAGCGGEADDAQGRFAQGAGPPGGGPEARATPVSARIAVAGDLSVTLRSSTNLRARETVEVIPKQAGVVATIEVEEGDRVAEGAVLARLDDEEWRLQARQEEARARAAAEAVTRARALADLDLISTEEVERLVSDSAVSAASFELARLRVENAAVRSPMSGVVTHRMVERGAQVGTAAPVFTVADVDRLEAQVRVPEREANRIAVGQPVSILLQEGAEPVATGRVERIRPVVDPGSGTVQVTVAVAAREDARLRPGQFVNVDIVTETLQDRITLPRTAVLVDGAVPRVFLVREGRAVETEVRLGYSRGDRVEVTSGVAPGDTVVVMGQDNLRADAPVRMMELDGRPHGAAPAVGNDAAPEVGNDRAPPRGEGER
jgi:membrane fusion protein, multidrug efflux system